MGIIENLYEYLDGTSARRFGLRRTYFVCHFVKFRLGETVPSVENDRAIFLSLKC